MYIMLSVKLTSKTFTPCCCTCCGCTDITAEQPNDHGPHAGSQHTLDARDAGYAKEAATGASAPLKLYVGILTDQLHSTH
jgi:hypothetical protein